MTTNVTNPRSQVNRHSLYERTVFRRGPSGRMPHPVRHRAWPLLLHRGRGGHGDVADYAGSRGSGRQVGWIAGTAIGCGTRTRRDYALSGERLSLQEVRPGVVRCLDLDENEPLPADKAVGTKSYDEYRK